MKRIVLGWLLAAAACGAETPTDIREAAERLEQKAAQAPAALGIEFRVRTGQALHSAWPELSQELSSRSVARLRSGVGWRITPEVMRALARLDPAGAISVLPRMQASYAEPVIGAPGQLHRIDDARSVYRTALARRARITAAFGFFHSTPQREIA